MKFTTSVNIERDVNSEFNYIVTPNSKVIFNEIVNNFKSGVHSFNIIGSYGTGKSSFLLAFEKNLKKEKIYFAQPNGQFNGVSDFEFFNIVGKYTSFENLLIEKFNLNCNRDNILQELEKEFIKLSENKKFIILLVDEFGKILEYAAKHNPEKELYFIQLFSEFVNNPKLNIIFLTTLHQNFNSYSSSLSTPQKNEWIKVKGRFKEIAFNEPVEQLLFLAAERIKTHHYEILNNTKHTELYKLITNSKLVSLSESIDKKIADELFPIDLLSASILTLALQKYGQNERSLFTFLEANENYSLTSLNLKGDNFYNLNDVFNYLTFNYYNFINTKYNPDNRQWAAINNALDKVESSFNENIIDTTKIVKVIGLLTIFSNSKGVFDKEFLSNYSKLSLNINNPIDIIEKLERFKIIKFATHKLQYVFVEGTDVDIELELYDAGANIQKAQNISDKIKQFIDLPYISAKAIQFEKGTPRFFEFKITEKPINEIPIGEIDGFINLIFGLNINEESIKEHSLNCSEAILFVWYKNTQQISDTIHEIDKINFVFEKVEKNDTVAIKELNEIRNFEIKKLNQLIISDLFTDNELIKWYFQGEQIQINGKTDLNKFLSVICSTIYSKTPVYKNEMVNKHKYSSAITLARKNFFNNLFEFSNFKNLKFEDDKFPPEKSIYLTLLKNTGIHRREDFEYILAEPTDKTYSDLWKVSEEFIESAKNKNKSIAEFINILHSKPIKLKHGFIDFWIPIFLFIKQEDFALFANNAFIPNLKIDIIDLLVRKPDDFTIKTFDITGVKLDIFNKYRELINLESKEKAEKTSFIETIRPFLTFYKDLPEYTKSTKRLSKNSLRLREAIAKAKDPEQTFFEDFPIALGFKNLDLKHNEDFLKDFVFHLQTSIKDLRTCFSDLINRIEVKILDTLGINNSEFAEYKPVIIKRYRNIKTHLLLPKQKSFYTRLNSPIDDKKTWITSLSHDLLNKPVEQMKDEEEEFLYEKIKNSFAELDNLIEIHKVHIENSKDEILKFDITTTNKGTITNQIIIPQNKMKQVNDLQKKIEEIIGDDENISKAALIKVLQQKIK